LAAVRNYEIGCLAALGVLGLSLVQRYGLWTLLPILVGVQAIYLRMRGGPLVLLLALQFQLFDRLLLPSTPRNDFELADVLQCAAVLGFVISHYRLQGLTHSLLPADLRRKTPEPSQRPVGATEFGVLLVAVMSWALVAQFIWMALPNSHGELGLPVALWRIIALIWAIGLLAIGAGGLFGYLQREQMTRDEAAMFFQDVLWAEYRGEQRRPNRWLAWARLRYYRRSARYPERVKELP
jgi:hypothetical protein